MQKVLLLTSLFPGKSETKIIEKSKGKPVALANNTFQKALVEGLSEVIEDECFTILNMPNIGAFPFNYSDSLYRPETSESNSNDIRDLSFINLVYVKHWHKYFIIKKKLKAFLNKNPNTIIICYDLYGPWMKALYELRNEYNFKSVCIVPDLPEFTGTPNTFLYKLNKILPHFNDKQYLKVFDGFVLISKRMVEALGIEDKPYIEIEGIYSISKLALQSRNSTQKNATFTILYAGALTFRNDVNGLIEAIRQIQNPNLRLELYGAGELVDDIISISKSEKRIIYKGQIEHDELLKKLVMADLLVNPRQPDKKFASYSFPSKTMEFMASGTPVLMYKLPSLPQEYCEYLYFIQSGKDISSSISQSISKIMQDSDRYNKGRMAQDFILKNKNSKVQAQRIINFINTL